MAFSAIDHGGAPNGTGARDGRERSDAELLADRMDPADSFAWFYRRHVAAIIHFVAGRQRGAEDVADIVSETFAGALKGRYAYRPEREHARLWLLAIAARRVADEQRRGDAERRRLLRLRNEAITLSQSDIDSYEHLTEDGTHVATAALDDLPRVQRAAVLARIVEERDYRDVAAILGLTEPASRQHVSRGLRGLREKLRSTR